MNKLVLIIVIMMLTTVVGIAQTKKTVEYECMFSPFNFVKFTELDSDGFEVTKGLVISYVTATYLFR